MSIFRECGKNTFISATSNLSTGYNLVVINIVHVMVQRQYCGGEYCSGYVTLASTSSLVGCSIGQLTFGFLGDYLGRSRALQLTMALSIFGALLSSCSVPILSDASSVFLFLAIARFIMGIGVGGVYPLSATIAAESSGNSSRGKMTSFVFSMQGVAYLLSPIVAIIMIAIFGEPGLNTPHEYGWAWRVTTAMGAVPGIILIPFRASETLRPADTEEADMGSPISQPIVASPRKAKKMSICEALKKREYWGKIIGTGGGWFLFDFTFYGNNLFEAGVLRDVFNADGDVHVTQLTGGLEQNLCLQMLVLALIALPGYYCSVCFLDTFGRRNIQLQGFFFMTVLFACLGAFYEPLRELKYLLLVIYGLTFFFSNFGPNSTTFIVAAEMYPPQMRTTMHGLSACLGMLGATLGSALMTPLMSCTSCSSMNPVAFMMVVCAAVAAAGGLVSFCFVEDRRVLGMEGEGDEDEVEATAGEYGAAGTGINSSGMEEVELGNAGLLQGAAKENA